MISQRASRLQKQFKLEKGFVILRAYYGIKAHIIKHLEINITDFDNLYWDDQNHRLDEENLSHDLYLLNVTVPVRFNLSTELGDHGGLFLS
mmetsp:Transcript_5849/g.9988  ORF Transcript_5849/g.9988 Transcript_5849/m.9988 type:complete len:91 (+) Transcript_5849:107-379(+)|eukprot:CAMPEP_0168625670 /NCGR_PEP_ID=MMETSP0449_2-20121227/10160_1 /TAXON_ID=1082188 /ORGANISM="Strombidium rassoulzadegani, Strain ras09" /LENGTH=90 /DNA_ID=CAMNT_0008667489 /DNA_START=101 /DNA_END=373 /DNA_ORIENTATION=+